MAESKISKPQRSSPIAIVDATREAWRRLEEVVAIPTYTVFGGNSASNIPYIDNVRSYIEGRMSEIGVSDKDLHIVEIANTYDEETRKPQKTLLIRLGPNTPGGVMFCGHSDVVSTEGQPGWNTSPYKPEIKILDGEERMYGRGTVDMKGGIEAAIQTMLNTAKNATTLKKPVYLAITHSEELGSLGFEDFQKALKKMEEESSARVIPESVIVAEATDSDVLFAHKGATGYTATIQGNRHANAFDYAAQLVIKFNEIQEKLIRDKATHDTAFDPPYAIVNLGILDYDPIKNSARIEAHVRTTPKAGFRAIDALVKKAVGEVTYGMENESIPSSVILDNAPISSYELNFTGIDGHSAYPENAVNAAVYIAKTMQEIQTVRKENFDVGIHFVEARDIGSAGNSIPGSGTLYITLQGGQSRIDDVWKDIQEKIRIVDNEMCAEQRKKNYNLRRAGKDSLPEVTGFGISARQVDPISPLNATRTTGTTSIAIHHDERLERPLIPKSDQSGVLNISNTLSNALGKDIKQGTGSFLTDAGFISAMIPEATVVVYGPGNLLGQGGHGVNEYIERKQIKEAITGNNALVDALCFQKTQSIGR